MVLSEKELEESRRLLWDLLIFGGDHRPPYVRQLPSGKSVWYSIGDIKVQQRISDNDFVQAIGRGWWADCDGWRICLSGDNGPCGDGNDFIRDIIELKMNQTL